jgi:SAM-dependent methyltransferase
VKQAPPRPCLAVVVPSYNEEATVGHLIATVLASPWVAEVILVDDGSTDGTASVVAGIDDPRLRYLRQPRNRGKGAALRRGFAEATAEYVVVQDADLEYDPDDYGRLVQPLEAGRADVVYGSRFLSGGSHRVLYFWHAVGNKLLTLLSNMATNLNLTDMETGYKCFRREVIQAIDIEEDRFGFEPEITAKLARAKVRIYEVGISYSGRTYDEGKKIGWRDGVGALWCIAKFNGPATDRPVVEHAPAGFDEADSQLHTVLDNLRDAGRYQAWIASMCEPYLGASCLEVGAGAGDMSELFASHTKTTATDVSPHWLSHLRDRFADGRAEVAELDLLDPDALPGRRWSSTAMVNVLEHLPDDRAALAAVHARLEPGGHVLLFVPAFEALYSRFDHLVGHHRRYTRRHLCRILREAGFHVVEARYVNIVGAVAWWVLARQLRQVPTGNRAVKVYDRAVVPWLSRLEARVSPPFGQSLFVAARRR